MKMLSVGLCAWLCFVGLSVMAEDKLPDDLFLKEAPAKAENVIKLKETAKEGDTVVMRGQIGGQEKDVFNASRAMLMLADMKLTSCNKTPGDKCETPWDFCCVPVTERNKALAIVQVVNEKGKLLKAGLKGASGMDHLTVVVVTGKVAKNEAGNFIVNATGIYVEPPVVVK